MASTLRWPKARLSTTLCVTLAALVLLSACAPAAPAGPAGPAAPARPAAPAQPAAPTPAPQPVTLTVTSALPATPAASAVAKWFGDKVTERTNSRISFKYQWGGALTKAGEELDAVKSGLADMAVVADVYYPTRLPLMNLTFAVPFSPADPKMVIEIVRELYSRFPAMRKELEDNNQIPLMYMPLMSYQVYGRVPVSKPEDFRGKRVGQAGGKYLPQAYQVMGASTVALPAPEKYQAFQTGVIDADVLAWEYIVTFKLYEVAKYMMKLDFGGHFVWALTVNKDTWGKLSPADQKLMQDLALEAEKWLVDEMLRRESGYIDTITKASGVTVLEWSPEDKQKWAQAMPNLPQQWADEMEARGLPGKQIMKTFIQLAKDKGHKWFREWTIQ